MINQNNIKLELITKFEKLSKIDKKYLNKIKILNNLPNGFNLVKLILISNQTIHSDEQFKITNDDLGIIYQERGFTYKSKYGDIYYNRVWIIQKKLNLKDLNNKRIFESPSGVKYIIDYQLKNNEYFNCLIFKKPTI